MFLKCDEILPYSENNSAILEEYARGPFKAAVFFGITNDANESPVLFSTFRMQGFYRHLAVLISDILDRSGQSFSQSKVIY